MDKLSLVTENESLRKLLTQASEAGFFKLENAPLSELSALEGKVLVDYELLKNPSKNTEETLLLAAMSKELNALIEKSLNELQRVKKLHEQIVPLREESIKGIKLLSKYGAGESSGGDFFDVIKGEGELLLLMTSSSSYVVSSMILSLFDNLRAKKRMDRQAMEGFLNSVVAEVLRVTQENPKRKAAPPQCFIARLDLKRKTVEGFIFGGCEFISDGKVCYSGNEYQINPAFFEQAWFEFKMERGERFLLLSPGVKKNCAELIDGRSYLSWLRDAMKGDSRNMLHETFYQLKKNRERDFLAYDASVIFIEVDQHALVQV